MVKVKSESPDERAEPSLYGNVGYAGSRRPRRSRRFLILSCSSSLPTLLVFDLI